MATHSQTAAGDPEQGVSGEGDGATEEILVPGPLVLCHAGALVASVKVLPGAGASSLQNFQGVCTVPASAACGVVAAPCRRSGRLCAATTPESRCSSNE